MKLLLSDKSIDINFKGSGDLKQNSWKTPIESTQNKEIIKLINEYSQKHELKSKDD